MTEHRFLRWTAIAAAIAWLAAPAAAGLLGLSEEVKLGRQVADELEKEYRLHPGGAMNGRVAGIGDRIALAAQDERPKIEYSFKVLADKQVNAVACPGGFVYAFRGLCRKMEDDQQLAAVLAHEVAHVTERHGMETLERALGWQLLVGLATGGKQSDLGNIALGLIMRGYSRSQEAEADRVGQVFLYQAGYDIGGMAAMLRTLHEASGGGGDIPNFLRTHPSDKLRIRRAIEREAEILLELGHERPAADPPRLAIVFQTSGEDDEQVREVGERLAEQLGTLLNGSEQFRTEFAGVRTAAEDERVADLSQLAADRGMDGAVGLTFAEPPIVTEGEGRKAKLTIKLAARMQVVGAGATEPEYSYAVESKAEKRDADKEKLIDAALERFTEETARELAKVIVRPPLAGPTEEVEET